MSEQNIELSICIATYNRGDYIAQTLDSIISQLEAGVELVIVDGASDDDTRAQVSVFEAKCSRIRYFCEATNSGVDQDFDKAVAYAQGDYVWLIADDDLLVPHAVQTVLKEIRLGYDLVVVNAEVGNEDFTRVLNKSMFNITDDRVYTQQNRDEFFTDAMQGLTFIGATVLRRELWNARDRESYYGSLFIHVGVIFQSAPIAHNKIIAQPLIQIRYGNAMWTPRSFEIWMFKWPTLVWSFSDFNQAVKSSVLPLEPWRRPMKLFQFRSKDGYTYQQYKRHFSELPEYGFRLLALLISVFPVFLANIIALLYLSLRQSGNYTPIYDLVNNQPILPLRRWLRRVYKF